MTFKTPIFRNFLIAYLLCSLLVFVLAIAESYPVFASETTRFLLAKQSGYLFLLYLFGSVPFGLIITKIMTNKDVRTIGSGNIGMTNVMRTGNKVAGILTLLGDFLKGLLPLIFLKSIGQDLFSEYTYFFTFLFPVLGHMYPCWLNFKGGKGIATGFGVAFAFFWPLASLMLVVWISVAKFTRLSSLAGLVAFACFPLGTLYYTNVMVSLWTFCLAGLVFLAHKDNIKRLLTGQETKFGDTSL